MNMQQSAPSFSREEISRKLKEILLQEAQLKGIGVEEISEDAHLAEDMGLDSTDVVAVIFAIEEAFDISIDDEEAATCTSLRAIEEAVYLRLSGTASPS